MKVVEIVIYDKDGREINRVVSHRYKIEKGDADASDLSTTNFIRFIASMFTNVTVGTNYDMSIKTIGGTTVASRFKGNSSTYNTFNNTAYCNQYVYISVGTGSDPPSRDDYALKAKLAEALTTITMNEQIGEVILTSTFVFGNDTTIYEVGLEIIWSAPTASSCNRFLLDRTVFTEGIQVPANTAVAISYRFII